MSVLKSSAFLFFSSFFRAINLSSSFCNVGINSDALLKMVIFAARSLSSSEGMHLRRHWKRFRKSFLLFRSRSLCEMRAFPSSVSWIKDSLSCFLDRSSLGGIFPSFVNLLVVSRLVLLECFTVLSPVTLTTSISSSSVKQKERFSLVKTPKYFSQTPSLKN